MTRLKIGPRELAFAAVKYPVIQHEPEVRDGSVRFVQSAGGHMGLPAPRRVSGEALLPDQIGFRLDDPRPDHR